MLFGIFWEYPWLNADHADGAGKKMTTSDIPKLCVDLEMFVTL